MPTVLYIYDALCGWCYGFSPVMQRLHKSWKDRLAFDALSGGMVPPEAARPVAEKAAYIAGAYKRVEEHSAVRFGAAYLRHIFHPEDSAWVEESETPAAALCLLKAAQPADTIAFTAAIQKAHMQDGADLSDPETYRPLAEGVGCDWPDFAAKLQSEEWRDEARYEAALVKQLGITGFPAVLLQTAPDKFYLIARGYTAYEDLEARLQRVLEEVGIQ